MVYSKGCNMQYMLHLYFERVGYESLTFKGWMKQLAAYMLVLFVTVCNKQNGFVTLDSC
jgi:hypothetical protein